MDSYFCELCEQSACHVSVNSANKIACHAFAAGEAVAPSYLLFGCRGEHVDFYYKELWQELLREGILAEQGLLTAFSRDQKQKVYVQDKLRDHSKLIWQALLEVTSMQQPAL